MMTKGLSDNKFGFGIADFDARQGEKRRNSLAIASIFTSRSFLFQVLIKDGALHDRKTLPRDHFQQSQNLYLFLAPCSLKIDPDGYRKRSQCAFW